MGVQINRHWQTIFQTSWIAALAATFVGCSDVRLAPTAQPLPTVEGKGELCITSPDEVKRWMKFLFVIDKSGSNDSTDNGAEKRAGNIEKFLQQNQAETSYQYGMIWFAGEEAGAYINDGNESNPIFTPSISVALDATNQLRQNDGGSTPYRAALDMAQVAIQTDIERHPDEESYYMVFFVSDGEPTDIFNDKELETAVTNLIKVNPTNIRLSTAYYGSNGDRAKKRLERMAELGNGKFIDFEASKEWNFNDLVVKPTTEPWQLKSDLVIYNLNAGFCIDGSIDVDSDGDGMCDKDERRYQGFDPANRFSFNDGYGDYFHWRTVRYGENLPGCTDRKDEDHDFLTACEEAYVRNDNPSPGIPQRSDPKNPDTDRDGILDGIETAVFLTRTLGFALDSFNLQDDYDGEGPARRQILDHRNPLVKDADQIGYNADVRPIVGRPTDCYSFHQSELPLYRTLAVKPENTLDGLGHKADENVISMHYIQARQSDPKGDGLYRYSLQKLMNDEATRARVRSSQALRFDPKAFKTYKYGKYNRGGP